MAGGCHMGQGKRGGTLITPLSSTGRFVCVDHCDGEWGARGELWREAPTSAEVGRFGEASGEWKSFPNEGHRGCAVWGSPLSEQDEPKPDFDLTLKSGAPQV